MLSPKAVCELRVALTVTDLDQALKLYRDGLGLPIVKEWASPQGRGYVLAVDHATLELIDRAQAEWIDQIEVGRRISGPVRLAFEVQNIQEAITALSEVGIRTLADPVQTPWGHLNVRLEAVDGMQITLFLQLPSEQRNEKAK